MKKYFSTLLVLIAGAAFCIEGWCADNDFFAKDPQAVYGENFAGIDYVTAIPGYKLDPQNALAIAIGENEYTAAGKLAPQVTLKAKRYIEYVKKQVAPDYRLYAAKDLGDYILLYFNEPKVADGGFELIYSKKLEKMIGFFSAGYKG